jgi:hypothetical protein
MPTSMNPLRTAPRGLLAALLLAGAGAAACNES